MSNLDLEKEEFIRLVNEYCNSNSKNYFIDADALFEYLEEDFFMRYF